MIKKLLFLSLGIFIMINSSVIGCSINGDEEVRYIISAYNQDYNYKEKQSDIINENPCFTLYPRANPDLNNLNSYNEKETSQYCVLNDNLNRDVKNNSNDSLGNLKYWIAGALITGSLGYWIINKLTQNNFHS